VLGGRLAAGASALVGTRSGARLARMQEPSEYPYNKYISSQ